VNPFLLDAAIGFLLANSVALAVQYLRAPARARKASGVLQKLDASANDYVRALRLHAGLWLSGVTAMVGFFIFLRLQGYDDHSITRTGAGLVAPALSVLISFVERWSPVQRRLAIIRRVSDATGSNGWEATMVRVVAIVLGIAIFAGVAWMLHVQHVDDYPALFWAATGGVALMLVAFAWLSDRSETRPRIKVI
jgi:hypothetical protein